MIRNQQLKLTKLFSQYCIAFKANASLFSNVSKYSGATKACKKFASPYTDKEKLDSITNQQTVKFII